MIPKNVHSWELSEDAALKLQSDLSSKVQVDDQLEEVRYVAGVDVAYEKGSDKLVAAVVVLDASTLGVVETVIAEDVAAFPYVPGLFSFRELPSLIKAFEKLEHTPDLVVCDGQGLAHPRRFGLACHLGVVFDIPTIGCGKSRLLGEANVPGEKRGSFEPLIDNDEIIGNVLRTQDGINPIYVSVGHRVSLETACDWVLRLSSKYRLPETTRMADQAVNARLKGLDR